MRSIKLCGTSGVDLIFMKIPVHPVLQTVAAVGLITYFTIGLDFCLDLDLEFSMSDMEFARTMNVPFGFDLGHDFDLQFSRSNMEFPIS